jgi:hypothetical protein
MHSRRIPLLRPPRVSLFLHENSLASAPFPIVRTLALFHPHWISLISSLSSSSFTKWKLLDLAKVYLLHFAHLRMLKLLLGISFKTSNRSPFSSRFLFHSFHLISSALLLFNYSYLITEIRWSCSVFLEAVDR